MTSLELLESFVGVKDKYVLEAHGEELLGNNIIPFESSTQSERTSVLAVKKQSRRRAPMKKSVLAAIIAAAILCLAGCAYIIMKLQEISIGDYTHSVPNPENRDELIQVTSEYISLQGLQGSVEYLATKEWQDFLAGYDPDGAVVSEIGNEPTGLEELGCHYQVYTREMYDKLQEIADKYGLKLHSELNVVDQEELDYRVGGSFMRDELSRGWAYIYEDGTFQFDGEALLDKKVVHMQFRRSVKGTLEEPILNIGNVKEYQEVSYETHCGESVLLELGVDHSLIYADFEECFVLMNVLAGTEDSFLDGDKGSITMDDLKRMADGIDFTILKNVITPDMRGDSVVSPQQEYPSEGSDKNVGAESEGNGEIGETEIDISNLGVEQKQAYWTVLTDIYHYQVFPGGRELGYDGWPMSDNRFALEDVDRDGSAELLVIYSTTSMAGQAHIVYDYDASTGGVREQFIEYPAVVYFDNGILKADASHNHTLSEKIWPYTLYRYNAETDSYDVLAQVEAWDKEIRDTDYEENAFPDDVDVDGDQTVYYIMETAEYGNRVPVDGEEYDRWYESYRNGADMVTIPYMALTEENISMIK